MIEALIDPADAPDRRAEKLLTIATALMRRMERVTDDSGAAYAQFQRAALLEDQVRDRTRDLERALALLNATNSRLAEAKAEAETARQNLASAIETIQEGFALFDRDDRLVMCNSRFGMHMQDLRGRLSPGLPFADYVAMASRSAFLALPETETPEAWVVRRMQRHLDRHVIFNVRMVQDHWVQVSEHRTADGGTVILQTDVTDIIRAERHERGKALDDQARIIRATLDHINQGVAIFDRDGRLVGWNRRLSVLLSLPAGRLRMGASFDQLLSRFRADLAFGAGMSETRLMDWVAGRTARAALSFTVRPGDGPILDVFAQGMPDGGFVMSFTDVTAEREALEALSRAKETLEARVTERTLELQDALAHAERANASRSRFVAAASHDLLQPLSAAKLFLSAIEAAALNPAARAALDKAQNALQSVEGILDALLDISKLESGKAAVSVGPVRLGRLLAQLHEEFAPLAATKGLRLTVVASRAVVDSDPAYLRRILQNLIGNAIRYTDTDRVLVGARRRPGAIEIEVRDTGPGIPAHAREDIFKEFHRLNARASASEGMGLGLAIVQRACALLDHPLTLDSTLGKGTTFRVGLPLAAEAPAAAPSAPVHEAPQTQGRIVFLVENDADLRRALAHLLETWGLGVLEAASGEEAFALIDEIGILPDLFLVDQQLGQGMDGLAFVAALHARHGAVPARLITADRAPALAQAARAAGLGLIHKPIDAAALRLALATPKGN
ncbi:PAS-domain containing protein [Rhodobacter sp. Har01]|uniref:hybrid sensor histidine kinase/response regulator n=1 Tax=Rhodobacter sp. Har01 TaxID=2883999 RepID=UPI001D097F29|nr:PAS-domain containing protein [Rhodobacter sp. Har01]MCB6177260.1 PAS-domain containing protein [Rhodobacter sp. Har01]